ncbi:MAG: thiamine pyrophosphate-binding protein [Chloroflexota bacterium]|nr:thiamine pyrophosphate-binding protein [Chloroflexota bacterium]
MESNVSLEIARYLRGLGVERAYGLPGGEVTHVIDAMIEVGIDWVLVHHEAAAAHMADAESQVTGRPAVCVSTVGPGASNLVNGVANSFLERSRVIAIVGEYDAAERSSMVHMNLDLKALFEPISAYVERIDAANLAATLSHATNVLQAPVPGPVTLLVSASDQRVPTAPLDLPAPLANGQVLESAAGTVADLLEGASRPALILGVGVRDPDLIDSARALVNALDLPVVITPKAKGWISSDDPRLAGVLASYGSSGSEQLLAGADLILAIGLDGTDFIRPWRFTAPLRLEPASRTDPSVPGEQIICELNLTLGELCESGLGPFRGVRRAAEARGQAEVDRSAGTLPARTLPDHMRGGLDPVDALRAIRRATPRSAITTCDVGMFKLAICQYWNSYSPRTFLVSNGLSTMAYGLPAASAAALAGDEPVVTLVGDGGLLMGAGELETLARLDLPVTVVVAVDSSLALIRLKAEIDDLTEVPNDFSRADYVALAEALGVSGRRARNLDELEDAVATAVSSGRPALIEVPVDYTAYRRMGG